MTKAELIKILAMYPDNAEIFLAPRKSEFMYGLLNSATFKEIDLLVIH